MPTKKCFSKCQKLSELNCRSKPRMCQFTKGTRKYCRISKLFKLNNNCEMIKKKEKLTTKTAKHKIQTFLIKTVKKRNAQKQKVNEKERLEKEKEKERLEREKEKERLEREKKKEKEKEKEKLEKEKEKERLEREKEKEKLEKEKEKERLEKEKEKERLEKEKERLQREKEKERLQREKEKEKEKERLEKEKEKERLQREKEKEKERLERGKEKEKIKFVKPIESKEPKKIIQFVNKFAKKNPEIRYKGLQAIGEIFYNYLFKKYKTECGFQNKNVVTLFLSKDISNNTDYLTKLRQTATNFAKCIKNVINKNQKFVSYTLSIQEIHGTSGHANILLYRASNHSIEHFEPHGTDFGHQIEDKKIQTHLKRFIAFLQESLKTENLDEIQFVPSNEVCPRNRQGLQGIQESSGLKLISEGRGYCAAWSMFFTEMCFKNPDFTAKEVLEQVFIEMDKMDKNKRKFYLHKVIQGYVNHIYTKIQENYSKFFQNTILTEENLLDLFYNEGISKENKKHIIKNINSELNQSDDNKSIDKNISDSLNSYVKNMRNYKNKQSNLLSLYKKRILEKKNEEQQNKHSKEYELISRNFSIYEWKEAKKTLSPEIYKFYKSQHAQFLKELNEIRYGK
jgi:hypothetical protein